MQFYSVCLKIKAEDRNSFIKTLQTEYKVTQSFSKRFDVTANKWALMNGYVRKLIGKIMPV